MHAFDARDRLRAQPFESLLEGALDFLLWSLEVIKGCPITVAESFPAFSAADDMDALATADRIAAVVS
jgi:hypothetical protein